MKSFLFKYPRTDKKPNFPKFLILENLSFLRGFSFTYDLIKCKCVHPQAPVAQKIADEVVFRRFKGEGVDFFKSNLTDPHQIFDMHLLETIDLGPSRFHFSVGFICFESYGFIAYSTE